MFVFFYRALKFSFQSFFRNIWLSIVTIVILVLTLFSVTLVAGINVAAEQAIEVVKEKVDVSVYFRADVAEEDVLNTEDALKELQQVKEITYTSKDEALQQFKINHADEPLILESIEELDENPLGATLTIKAHAIEDYPAILSVIDVEPHSSLIQYRNYDDNELVIDRLSTIASNIQSIGISICIVFVVIAILIIFNTIRINIYTHREEIGIMKLVGATNTFVRSPFLIESFMYAIFAVVISIAILFPLLGVVGPYVDEFFKGYSFDLVKYFTSHLWQIVGLQLVFAGVLSFLSSSIAIGRYLRV